MDVTFAVVSVVEPEKPVKVALMVVWPVAAAVVIPEALMSATAGTDESQATRLVRSCVASFDKMPIALNCRVVPTMLVKFAGVTSMETNAAEVKVVEPDTLPEVAVMMAEPAATALAIPFEPSTLLTEATPPFDEFHVTEVVMSWMEPFEKNPVALNCTVVPGAILVPDGVTVMEVKVAGVDFLPPHPASIRTVVSTTRRRIAVLLTMDKKLIELAIGIDFKDSSILIGLYN